MKARIVRIGNSRGVRIPKPPLEQAGLGEEVELRVEGAAIVTKRAGRPRAGWAEAFRAMRAAGDDALLGEPTPTRFDEEEWEWRRPRRRPRRSGGWPAAARSTWSRSTRPAAARSGRRAGATWR